VTPLRRVLALDLGDRRVGYALSDPLGLTAQPAGEFESRSPNRNVETVRGLVTSHDVGRVVVGHPLLLSGESGERAEQARRFADLLRRSVPGIEVDLWDERLTTREAERVLVSGSVRRGRRREVVDRMAAALLLQSYLDAKRAGPPRYEDPSA
jgi:putative Holliday junction resolvase